MRIRLVLWGGSAVVQLETLVLDMRAPVPEAGAVSVGQSGAAFDAVHHVALIE